MEQTQNQVADKMRQLLEIAHSAGRGWQSSQTGYIHFCYNQLDEDYHHPIPIYENMLFALSLTRSRNVENINEAKELLGRLLHFQNDADGISHGNFPIYIHEYPYCRDSCQAIQLIPPLYWIYKQFHHVIGNELKGRLETALKNALSYGLKVQKEKRLSYPMMMKIATSTIAIGRLFACKSTEEEGDRLFNAIERSPGLLEWNSPSSIADILVAFQMVYPSLSNSPETLFWNHISDTWHRSSEAYCGPGVREYQNGRDQQTTLYDYFMGYFSGSYSYRSFFDHPIQLQAALIHPTTDELPNLEYPFQRQGSIESMPWQVNQMPQYAFSLLSKNDTSFQQHKKGYHALKLMWGKGCLVHSIVCQPLNASNVNFEANRQQIILYATLEPIISGENPEKNQELSLYIDQSENLTIHVLGVPSTTFQIGETIAISDETMQLKVKFELHEGNGSFFGHIMKGNRPSQIALKGVNRFEAYDWQLFLRSIQRNQHCIIKVTIEGL